MAFITFEGMDGAGKTSTSAEVARRLIEEGYPIRYVDKKSIDFDNPYLRQHVESVKALIWGYPATAPIERLGDGHWLHLMASWFHLLDETVVQPSLQAGQIVIVDSWVGKFLARFAIKSANRGEMALLAFTGISVPDLTVFLDVNPAVAAARKNDFTIAECGNLDGYSGVNSENFVAYQSQIREALAEFSVKWRWQCIETSEMEQEKVALLCMNIILQYLNRDGGLRANARP